MLVRYPTAACRCRLSEAAYPSQRPRIDSAPAALAFWQQRNEVFPVLTSVRGVEWCRSCPTPTTPSATMSSCTYTAIVICHVFMTRTLGNGFLENSVVGAYRMVCTDVVPMGRPVSGTAAHQDGVDKESDSQSWAGF